MLRSMRQFSQIGADDPEFDSAGGHGADGVPYLNTAGNNQTVRRGLEVMGKLR